MPELKSPDSNVDYGMDPSVLNNTQYILKDIIQGDISAFKEIEGLDMTKIRKALDFLLDNSSLTLQQKSNLLSDSWRINYLAKPPTPEEFLTPKYIGPTADSIYPYIKDIFIKFLDPTKPYRNLILYPFIGFGKGSYYGDRVFTPEGYVLAEDLKIGDKVSTPDGGTSTIIGTMDAPDADIYELTFSDGRKARVGGPHNWKAFVSDTADEEYIENGTYCPEWSILTTEDILEDMESNPSHRWYIPVAESPVYHEGRPHIIPPYTMGAMIGRGDFCNPSGTCTLSSKNENVHLNIQKESAYDYIWDDSSSLFVGNLEGCREEMERLGLHMSDRLSLSIPDEYLYDSVENRMELLRGLMDTCGEVDLGEDRTPGIYISIERGRMSEGIMDLVRSLGGVAILHHDTDFRGYCSMEIHFDRNGFDIFSDRKDQDRVDLLYSDGIILGKYSFLGIESIEKTNLKGFRCIEIDDSERLYLTGDYVVTHNSFLSTLVTLYISVNVSMMRDPSRFFGLSKATQFSQFLLSYSLKKSSELLLEPFTSIMESSPFFEKERTLAGIKEKEDEFRRENRFDKMYYSTAAPTSALSFASGLTIKLASSPQAILGTTIVSIVMSELAFFTLAGKTSEFIMNVYNKSVNRVDSRMHGNYFGRTILDSSPNDLNNAIDQYIMYEAPKNKKNYIVKGSMWEWRPDQYREEFDNGQTFKVYTGGNGNPPRILDPNDPLLKRGAAVDPSKIIEVPNSLYDAFDSDVVEALKDNAGIPSGSADTLITDYEPIESMFGNNLRNMYTSIHAPASDSPIDLIWNQIESTFFRNRAGKFEFYYKPRIPRCVSVDQSYATDVCTISMTHPERYFDSGEDIYVTDFTIAITPTRNDHVNLEAVHQFILDLRDKGNLNISHVSFDHFESQTTIQNLKREGFDVEILSVDLKMDPYLNYISLLKRHRLAVGKNIFLKNNLKSLHIRHRESGKSKIDHDDSRAQILSGDTSWNKSLIGFYGKDVSDSVCASIELCRKYFNVVDEMWTGGPKKDDFSSVKEMSSAFEKTSELLNKMGLRF